jgi:forkhead box protein K
MPSRSPPPPSIFPTPPPIPEPQIPNTNPIGKINKKRKKGEAETRLPKPDVMPPKPAWTYSQACYRAIKALGGKATLQDIVGWMMDTYDYYKYVDGNEWKVRPVYISFSNLCLTPFIELSQT